MTQYYPEHLLNQYSPLIANLLIYLLAISVLSLAFRAFICIAVNYDAKARGVKFGRPKKEMPDNFGELATMWFNGQITGSEAARKCGVALSTFRNRAERLI